jgi:hypothetical protein
MRLLLGPHAGIACFSPTMSHIAQILPYYMYAKEKSKVAQNAVVVKLES